MKTLQPIDPLLGITTTLPHVSIYRVLCLKSDCHNLQVLAELCKEMQVAEDVLADAYGLIMTGSNILSCISNCRDKYCIRLISEKVKAWARKRGV